MVVRCNKPYVLKMDDVVWSPIGTRDGGDEYVLSTGGMVTIFVDGTRVFFFRNEITPDFAFGSNEIKFKVGDTRVAEYSSSGTYNQRRFTRSDIDGLYIALYPTGGSSVVDGLEVSASQGTVTEGGSTTNYKVWNVTGIDASEHFVFKVGNVLLSFVLPFEG